MRKDIRQLAARLGQALPGVAQAVGAFLVSNPVQGGLLIVNVVLLKSVLRALRRARFASHVRVLRDLKDPADVLLLLGQLPPWIHSPDWERGDAVQTLLNLLWPAINTTVCALVKRELEERVQEASDFGHIEFARLSFGKHPPVVAGIKAVPLESEDLMAMVLDVDVRWAGEPDVQLRLTKLAGATLGLSNVQLAGVVRLVFSPITEDPPFLRRMAVSLLTTPHIDFSISALGGPDLMSLPAISSWLHAVVLNLTQRALVWPREIGVPLAPPRPMPAEGEDAATHLAPPLGILVVRVDSADIVPRRSTFLGRLKLVSPRLSVMLPAAPGEGPSGSAGRVESSGVVQAGSTRVAQDTLKPCWAEQFVFVVTSRSQSLQLMLSHQRMELLGADMPLGLAELGLDEVVEDAQAAASAFKPSRASVRSPPLPAAASSPALLGSKAAGSHPVGWTPARAVPMATPAGVVLPEGNGDDDACSYASAPSSPTGSSSHSVVWATPSTSLLHPEELNEGLTVPSDAAGAGTGAAASASHARARVLEPRPSTAGLELLLDGLADRRPPGQQLLVGPAAAVHVGDSQQHAAVWMPHHPALASPPPPHPSRSSPDLSRRVGSGRSTSGASGLSQWVDLSATGSVTLSGMVSDALQPRQRAGTPFGSSAEDQRGWLSSTLQSFMGGQREEEEGEGEVTYWAAPGASVGRVSVKLQFFPVAAQQRPLPRSASLAQPSPARRGGSSRAGWGAGATSAAAAAATVQANGTGAAVPRPPALASQSGVLAVRVSYTKLDYGESPGNPVLAVSTLTNLAAVGSKVSAAAAASLGPQRRLVCLDAQPGGRPGLLHWDRVFHLPVWDAAGTRACLELGDAASALKLSSYGPHLFALDACESFEADVTVEATALVPIKDALARGVVQGTWRLREVRSGGGVGAAAGDRLDLGRVALTLWWFPLA